MPDYSSKLLVYLGAIIAVLAFTIPSAYGILQHYNMKESVNDLTFWWLVFAGGAITPLLILVSLLWCCVSRNLSEEKSVSTQLRADNTQLQAEKTQLEVEKSQLQKENARDKSTIADLTTETENLAFEKEHLQRKVSELEDEKKRIVQEGSSSITCVEIARYFLDQCSMDVMYLAMEISREQGPQFVKAKNQQLKILKTMVSVFQSRFERDKEMIRRLDKTDVAAYTRFTEAKTTVIRQLEECKRILERNVQRTEDAQQLLREVGDKIAHCARELKSRMDQLTPVNHPHRG